ncbi:MAG: hypothetical protein HXK69_02760 [Clostridiales bacterium]|mgnify:FL=1|jgi:hypothetical protein|nr:hypothetical protein [Clostridiales bacterium]
MENTSKALIMAGETLIAILVIGLFVTINTLFGRFSKNINKQLEASNISVKNAVFMGYEGRVNILVTEVASIINYAKKLNDDNGLKNAEGKLTYQIYNSPGFVKVYINGIDYFAQYINSNRYSDSALFKEDLNRYMQDNNTRIYMVGATITGFSEKNVNGKIEHVVYKRLIPNSILIHKDTALVNGIKIETVPDNLLDRYNFKTLNDFNNFEVH